MKLEIPGISVPIEADRGGNRQNIHFSITVFVKLTVFLEQVLHPEGVWALESSSGKWSQHQTCQSSGVPGQHY